MMDRVKTYKNVLNDFEFEYVNNVVQYNSQWISGGVSVKPGQEGFKVFWYKGLQQTSLYDFFGNKITCLINKKNNIVSIYANAQSHGQCGMFHKDTPGCEYTLVYYVHRDWKPQYGGHLMIDDKQTNELHSIWPETNSAVIFKSDILHCGLEPTVHCNSVRMSIAVKFNL